MTLRGKLGALAATFVVVLGAVGVLGVLLAASNARAHGKEYRSGVALEKVLRLQSAYVDMETGARGFVIVGAETFLEPYGLGATQIDELQASLVTSTAAADPVTAADLAAVVDAGRTWRILIANVVDLRRSQGRAVAEAVIEGQGPKRRFDTLRFLSARLSTRLLDQRREARAESERTAGRMTWLLFALPAILVAFTLASGWLMARWIVRPLRRLLLAVRSITSGDLSTNVSVGGAADVAEVGRSVDILRITIEQRLNESERLREAAESERETIEQSAIVTLQVRGELANTLGRFPPGWTAAADLLPAEGWAAGDCYDLTLVAPHMMGLLVLDISGHGAAQSIMALRCKEILRAALRAAMEPGDALGLLAQQVGSLSPSFVTVFLALIDTATGACRYANAGHPPALLVQSAGRVTELGATGPLLGVFPASWSTQMLQMEAGARLVVYTDGLTEARNDALEFYGVERLARLVTERTDAAAESPVKVCLDDLHAFRPLRPIDDVTLVLVCRSYL